MSEPSDECEVENGEPGEEKEGERPLHERILESSEPADKTMGAIATVLGKCGEPACKIIDALGVVGLHITKAKAKIDAVSDERIVALVRDVRKEGDTLGVDAVDLAKHVLSCEQESQRMGLQFAQDSVDKVIDGCVGLAAMVLGINPDTDDPASAIPKVGLIGKLIGLDKLFGADLSELSAMTRAGAFGIGDDGQPNEPPPPAAQCGVCGVVYNPYAQLMGCPHDPRPPEEPPEGENEDAD